MSAEYKDRTGHREGLADRLNQYLNSGSPARVIAIDGAWGTGKSWFADYWLPQLNASCPGRAIKYDAHAHDSDETPLPSLIAALTEFVGKDQGREIKKSASRVLSSVLPATPKLLTMAFSAWLFRDPNVLKETIGDDPADAISAATRRWLDEAATAQQSVHELSAALSTIEPTKGGPRVVIIDELDRCRPDFAIQVIEFAKHFFAVDASAPVNVVFVLLLNRGQLENFARHRYGDTVDTAGYFNKYVDLWIGLNPSYDKYSTSAVVALWKKTYFEPDATVAAAICLAFRLSLRDVERVIACVRFSGFEGDLSIIGPACLKVKHPQMFDQIVFGSSQNTKTGKQSILADFFDDLKSAMPGGNSTLAATAMSWLNEQRVAIEWVKDFTENCRRLRY